MTDKPDLPFLDMAEPGFSTRSQAVYDARAKSWCARTPYGLAVLRHREVGQLLCDRRLRQGSYAWPDINGLRGSFAEFWKRSIISREGKVHKTLRSLAVPSLSQDFVESLRPEFDRIADRLARRFVSRGQGEFMAEFSTPFAGQAICILLGLPDDRWLEVAENAIALGFAMGVDCKIHEPEFNAACDQLMHLADELIGQVREGRNRDSYVARLVERFDNCEALDEQALRDMIVISVFGGVDTTRAQLGFAVDMFINHPDQWQLLCANPSLIPPAIEEIIRTHPTTTWSTREAMEDFHFKGVRIPQGETLHMLVNASATDPAVCDDPAFDITARRKMHFGFGGGAHHCLGQMVARTDMSAALAALSSLVERWDYTGEPEWLPDSGNTSPIRLPVRAYRVESADTQT